MANANGSVTGITRRDKCLKKTYECVNYKKYGKSRCVYHNIKEEWLIDNVKNFMMLLKNNYLRQISNMKLLDYGIDKKGDKKEIERKLKNLEAEYKVLVSQKIKELAICTKDKKSFIESTYKNLEDEKYKDIQELRNRLKEIENLSTKKEQRSKQALDYFDLIIENEKIDKAILNMLIDKIYIYHDKSVEIKLKIDINKLL